ncbi:MAG: hypothetical protein ACKOX6_06445 [Bdellovibrio sp.]
MKILNSLFIAILSLTFVTSNAHATTTQVTDPANYLKQQLAEVADLKEQIVILKKKKHTAKVVLAVATTAAISSLIVTNLAREGQALIREVQTDLRIPLTQTQGVNILTVGLVSASAAGVAIAASGGYLIYLNAVELRNLEQQIDQIQAEINSTLIQLVLSKQ